MEEIKVNITYHHENELVSIQGLQEDNLEIDCKGDVYFTRLIGVLSDLINENEKIEVSLDGLDDDDDHKVKLIIDTVSEIFEAFNDSSIEENKIENSVTDISNDDELSF